MTLCYLCHSNFNKSKKGLVKEEGCFVSVRQVEPR